MNAEVAKFTIAEALQENFFKDLVKMVSNGLVVDYGEEFMLHDLRFWQFVIRAIESNQPSYTWNGNTYQTESIDVVFLPDGVTKSLSRNGLIDANNQQIVLFLCQFLIEHLVHGGKFAKTNTGGFQGFLATKINMKISHFLNTTQFWPNVKIHELHFKFLARSIEEKIAQAMPDEPPPPVQSPPPIQSPTIQRSLSLRRSDRYLARELLVSSPEGIGRGAGIGGPVYSADDIAKLKGAGLTNQDIVTLQLGMNVQNTAATAHLALSDFHRDYTEGRGTDAVQGGANSNDGDDNME